MSGQQGHLFCPLCGGRKTELNARWSYFEAFFTSHFISLVTQWAPSLQGRGGAFPFGDPGTHWLANVGRISSDPSCGYMATVSEAPRYGLAKLLLFSTVLFKYHVRLLCEGERGWTQGPSCPSPLLRGHFRPHPQRPAPHPTPSPPSTAHRLQLDQEPGHAGPTLPSRGMVVCREP